MSHTFHKIYYHLVWSTKYRAPLISPSVEADIRIQVFQRIKKIGARQLALNMTEDHIHLLVDFPPSVALSDFVHDIKGGSAHYINAKNKELSLRWQNGYGALTLSEDRTPNVIRYIKNQKQHHASNYLWQDYESVGI